MGTLRRGPGDIANLWLGGLIVGGFHGANIRNAIKANSSNNQEHGVIARAMLAIAENTCIKFERRGGEADYVDLKNERGEGCYTMVGRSSGRNIVMLETNEIATCLEYEIVIHELMHTIGLWHEQMRYDRDDYIKVHWENIGPAYLTQFEKVPETDSTTYGVRYDYQSVMHYAKDAFASATGKITMETLDILVPVFGLEKEGEEGKIRNPVKIEKEEENNNNVGERRWPTPQLPIILPLINNNWWWKNTPAPPFRYPPLLRRQMDVEEDKSREEEMDEIEEDDEDEEKMEENRREEEEGRKNEENWLGRWEKQWNEKIEEKEEFEEEENNEDIWENKEELFQCLEDYKWSSTEHTIDGPLRLGQLIDNLEIELASRVTSMHCGDVLIYGRNNITDPLPDYYEQPLQEAVNICIENERVDAEGRSLAGSAYGRRSQKPKKPKIVDGTYYFLVWCEDNISSTYKRNFSCITEKCVCQSPYRTREVGVKRLLIPNLFVESKCDSGDIALLELMEEVNYRKIHLARPNTPLPSNKILYASGYGYDPERKILTDMDELKTVEVNVLAKCPKYLEREDDAICADEVVLDQNGDSGASLKDIGNVATIFGVVSFGSLCDDMLNDDLRSLPIEERKYKNAEVYTNITHYLPFICGIIGLNESIGCLIEDIKRAKKQPYFEIKRNGKI
uniref:Metalloendopeptidase n=1 Tax=Meloidogyne javanica TaxID=6303 RepID=A0A915M1D4_MELJA